MPVKILATVSILVLFVLAGCQTTPSRESKSPEQQLQDQLLSGQRLLSERKYEAALAEFHVAQQLDPENPAILMVLARIHDVLGNEDTTKIILQRLLELSPSQSQALEMLGLIELNQGQRDSAREKLTRAEQYGRESWKLFNALGVLADYDSNFSQARSYYRRALQQPNANISTIQNNLGYSYYLEGELVKALGVFNKVIHANPKFDHAKSNKGLLLVRQGKSTQALGVFKEFMSEEKALNNVGSLNFMFKNYKEAERYFMLAIKKSPNYFAEARKNLEKVRSVMAQNEKAN